MAVRFAEKMVAAAGAWQRGPKFAPYQTIGNYDERTASASPAWTAGRPWKPSTVGW